jgi:hypothetical protein
MNALVSLAQATGGMLTDTLVAWFAILGGAAGFISLAITLARLRTPPSVAPAPAPTAAPAPAAPVSVTAPVAPAVPTKLVPPTAPVDDSIPAEVMALISAAVAMTLGRNARIAAVVPVPAPSVEMLQQWSIEGRRQIYSSHQIR